MSFKKVLYIVLVTCFILSLIFIMAWLYSPTEPNDDDIILLPPEIIISGTIDEIQFVREDTLTVAGENTKGEIWNVSFEERSNVNFFISEYKNIHLPVLEFVEISGYYMLLSSEPKQIVVITRII